MDNDAMDELLAPIGQLGVAMSNMEVDDAAAEAALAEVLHEQRTNPALGELIAAAQELFEPVPENADVGSAARKWVDAQEIRDEQEREKKTLDDIGTGGAPIIRSAPHEGSKL